MTRFCVHFSLTRWAQQTCVAWASQGSSQGVDGAGFDSDRRLNLLHHFFATVRIHPDHKPALGLQDILSRSQHLLTRSGKGLPGDGGKLTFEDFDIGVRHGASLVFLPE